MDKAGVWIIRVGALLTGVGLLAGFGALFADHDRWAMVLLGLVPFGFLGLMLGVVLTLFGRP